MSQKNYLLATAFIMFLITINIGCKKSNANQTEDYVAKINCIDFNDSLVTAYQKSHMFIDIDSNGRTDISVKTYGLGIPQVDTTKIIFEIGIHNNFEILVDANDQVTPMEVGDTIPTNTPTNKQWVNLANTTILQKIQPQHGNPFWIGQWKQKVNKAFAFRFPKNNEYYYGWLTLSSDELFDGLRVKKVCWYIQPNKNKIRF